jgi:hypothetical protein
MTLLNYYEFVKAHEKLLVGVLIAASLFFGISKGVDAWVSHDKTAVAAMQQQIDVLHEDNARVHDDNFILMNQLSVLKEQVEENNTKSDKIIAQLRKKTSDQQTVDMQLPPLQLAERWTVLLDLPANSVAPAPDNKYLLTNEAARATVIQLEQVAPLVEENIQLEAQLAGEKQIVAKQDEVIGGLNKEIAGKDQEIKDEIVARRLEVKLAKAETKKAFIKGFKWGFAAGAATVIAIRVGLHF